MKRADALTFAKIAGYHDDSAAFTRLIVEQRVNRQAMNSAWHQGKNARAVGVPCSCRECHPR